MEKANPIYPKHRLQRGVAAVEFALVALIFFTILFGIIEFGRVLYVYNTIQEVTRNAAREAVVRNFNTDVAAIQRESIFRGGTTGTVYLPAGLEISNASVQISYLTDSLIAPNPMPTDPVDNIAACKDTTRSASCIRYVQACVSTVNACTGTIPYFPIIGIPPFNKFQIQIPVSTVIMPAESLGSNSSS
jgi:hypothetical protein